MIRRASFAALAVATALSACGTRDPLPEIMREPPSIRGTITLIQPARTSGGRSAVRIEERPDQASGDEKAVVSLTAETLLYERQGTSLVAIALDSVETGWLAEAWFVGPVAESYPVQASASLLVVERTAAADKSVLFQTDSLRYTLRAGNEGYSALIGVRFTNRTPDTTYFINCRGTTEASLEKLVRGEWQTAYSPIMLSCLSPPIIVAPGAERSMPIHVIAGYPGSNWQPQFSVSEINGTYRAAWNAAVTDYQNQVPFGRPLPLAQRISNRFTLDVPPR